eukprot:GHVU01205979.1.p1 GENE.GHVU01205979.1~~GHVU01205979.1.p1  ORF type:complete len:145 (+),score=28.24 GHVU01205979.1:111-545(+)
MHACSGGWCSSSCLSVSLSVCLQQAKMIERVTVDYSRFSEVAEEEEDCRLPVGDCCSPGSTAASAGGEPVIEFSDELDEEQRRQLSAMLTGQLRGGCAMSCTRSQSRVGVLLVVVVVVVIVVISDSSAPRRVSGGRYRRRLRLD